MYNYYAAVFETPLIEGDATEVKAVVQPVKIELLRGKYTIQTRSHGRAILPLRGIVGEELEIPALPAILTDPQRTYVLVCASTELERDVAEKECSDQIDRAITMAALMMNTYIFARPLYRGWLGADPRQFRFAEVLFTPWQVFEPRAIEKSINAARAVLARNAEHDRRFGLMTRLFNRAITLDDAEQTFLWLWTCLEVFPMVDTTNVKPISEHLAPYVDQTREVVAEKLQIGRLFGHRCTLVHDGSIGLSGAELNEAVHKLLVIVESVLRSMCGMPYNGALNRWLCPAAA